MCGAQLHLIGRYTGVSADEAPLHRLGSASGEGQAQGRRAGARHRRRSAEPVRPPRGPRGTHRYSAHDYEAFAASFGFEETPDQRAAIHA